jgi:hypothetical protein
LEVLSFSLRGSIRAVYMGGRVPHRGGRKNASWRLSRIEPGGIKAVSDTLRVAYKSDTMKKGKSDKSDTIKKGNPGGDTVRST